METKSQPTVCKSAHRSAVICLAFSSFPASVLTLPKIKRSLTCRALDKMILLIPRTPVRHVILQVFFTAWNSCQSPKQEDYLDTAAPHLLIRSLSFITKFAGKWLFECTFSRRVNRAKLVNCPLAYVASHSISHH